MLSQAVEDYLKAIYTLQGDEAASTTDIAQRLGVSSASVTNMVKRLAQMNLVEYQSYRGVMLTESGEKIALEIIRHHRLLETYLKEVMNYSWEQMHEEAEQLEHHISEEFEKKIDELLGYPTHDPHGHPIPTPEGIIEEPTSEPLSAVESGQEVVVSYLSDTDAELLDYLEKIGLLPGSAVKVKTKAPFNGPLTVEVKDEDHVIGHQVATHVFVTQDE